MRDGHLYTQGLKCSVCVCVFKPFQSLFGIAASQVWPGLAWLGARVGVGIIHRHQNGTLPIDCSCRWIQAPGDPAHNI